MCSVIARGQLPQGHITPPVNTKTHALSKKNGDVRPIATGEVFRSITAKSICTHLRGDFRNCFSPILVGLCLKLICETPLTLSVGHISFVKWNLHSQRYYRYLMSGRCMQRQVILSIKWGVRQLSFHQRKESIRVIP